MPNDIALDPTGAPVTLPRGLTIRTPGLAGRAQVFGPSTDESRASVLGTGILAPSMRNNELRPLARVEIQEPREQVGAQRGRGADNESELELRVPDPGVGWAQVLLYQAEDGTLSWHFVAVPVQRPGQSRSTAPLSVFRIPRAVLPPPAEEASVQRGPVGAFGTKVLELFAFRLLRTAAGWAGERFAEKIEERHRPHRLRTFTPDDYTAAPETALRREQLTWFGEGRCLLLVHGTFSTAHGSFGRLPARTVRELFSAYGGRVLALDHPTVSRTPVQNVHWLTDRLRESGTTLEVDLLCHSRGGLVGRTACERPDLVGAEDVLRIGSMVLVGTPNAGTALADVPRLEQLVNRFMLMLRLIPDAGVTDLLDVVLAVVKHIAAGIVTGLDGLMAMNPQGEFLTGILPATGVQETRYYAAAADYDTPPGSRLARMVGDGVADFVFGGENNDLVVPTTGALALSAPGDSVSFDATHAVNHFGYFDQPQLTDRLGQWLSGELLA